jgi:hypothetical protein
LAFAILLKQYILLGLTPQLSPYGFSYLFFFVTLENNFRYEKYFCCFGKKLFSRQLFFVVMENGFVLPRKYCCDYSAAYLLLIQDSGSLGLTVSLGGGQDMVDEKFLPP